jgi:uncharacterized protein (TIGR02246 family)
MKTVILGLAALMLSVMPASAKQAKETPAIKAAMEMVKSWNELNLDKMMNMFTEDAVLDSVMIEPIKGREAIRPHLAELLKGATRLELKLKNVAAVDNIVFLERVDDFDFRGKHGAVPVVGVMEIENGKVKVWREYYDRAMLMREMGLMPPPAK